MASWLLEAQEDTFLILNLPPNHLDLRSCRSLPCSQDLKTQVKTQVGSWYVNYLKSNTENPQQFWKLMITEKFTCLSGLPVKSRLSVRSDLFDERLKFGVDGAASYHRENGSKSLDSNDCIDNRWGVIRFNYKRDKLEARRILGWKFSNYRWSRIYGGNFLPEDQGNLILASEPASQ